MRELYERWSPRVTFVDVVVRQSHPGGDVPAYTDVEQKLEDGATYKCDDGVPWTVLADDVDGRVHRKYGGMSDPTYVIDRDGRVAFYNMWTHVPTLERALGELFEQGGRGTVLGGVDRFPHVLAALANGWGALERGFPRSFLDTEAAIPGSGAALWIGSKLKPVLAPVALRSTPIPPAARIGIGLGVVGLALLLARRRAA